MYPKMRLIVFFFTLLTITNCESDKKYFRPDLPEKLCSIGMITADDTIRFISFEKSYQIEYSDKLNDSLRNFSFSLSDADKELYNFKTETIKNIVGHKLPDTITFRQGSTYYLRAFEKDCPEIYAECTVPALPDKPVLDSYEKETIVLSEPMPCTYLTDKRSIQLRFSFKSQRNSYYAILVKGFGYSLRSEIFGPVLSILDFSVRDCNSPGFSAVLYGYFKDNWICDNNLLKRAKSPVFAYFLDGNIIPEQTCHLKISSAYHDGFCIIDILQSIKITLLSISRDLFLFEKSLFTYKQSSQDPFSEPVYLNGNIKNGNGVFSICRSSELIINFKPFI